MNTGKLFETGIICNEFTAIESTSIDFIPHKTFNGVSLKHLVKGEKTNNQLSCHLVKVEPFCSLETHVHADSLEIHEIIYGDGECQIAENQVKYSVGCRWCHTQKYETQSNSREKRALYFGKVFACTIIMCPVFCIKL